MPYTEKEVEEALTQRHSGSTSRLPEPIALQLLCSALVARHGLKAVLEGLANALTRNSTLYREGGNILYASIHSTIAEVLKQIDTGGL